MLIDKKIKSFTISEMLVVMVLTTIVIAIAILVLNLVQQQLTAIQGNFKNNTEIRTLEQTLWVDINKGEVFFNASNKELICISPLDTISYKFQENYVLRNLDTLNIEVEEQHFFIDLKNTIQTVDAIELKLSNKFQNRELFIHKQKGASYYMNNNGI
jgi:type II secretory pathway component PulJ